MAANMPAPVKVSERPAPPAEPPAPSAAVAEVSGTVTDAPPEALILRGPPLEARPPRLGLKQLLWLGLGLGLVAVAVLAGRSLKGRAKPAEPAGATKDELKAAPGLLMKEPMNLPPETALAEGP